MTDAAMSGEMILLVNGGPTRSRRGSLPPPQLFVNVVLISALLRISSTMRDFPG